MSTLAATARRPGIVVPMLGFVALLAGRFTLDRVGFDVPVVNDPRAIILWLILVCLGAETADAVRQGARMALTVSGCTGGMLLFFGYQAVSAAWTPEGARLARQLTDLVALSILLLVYSVLAALDRDRLIRLTLISFLAAGAVYFLAAASGRGHDPSGRWAALGGGSNVFVRIMILAAVAAVYLYGRGYGAGWLLTLPVFLVGALFSGSRGGLLAATCCLALFIVRRLPHLRLSHLLRILLGGVPLGWVTWLVVGDHVWAVAQQRYVSLTFDEGYTSGRDVLFAHAIALFSDHPAVGAGLDGFYAIYGGVGQEYVHSLPLAVAAEGGLLGLALLSVVLVGTGLAVLRCPRTLEGRTAAYCAVFIGIASLFSGDYYDARLMWVFLILAATKPSVPVLTQPDGGLPRSRRPRVWRSRMVASPGADRRQQHVLELIEQQVPGVDLNRKPPGR